MMEELESNTMNLARPSARNVEETITFHREALALRPPGHPDRSSFLINLAIAIDTRYDQSGRMEDLQEAITYYREALALCPPGHPRHCNLIDSLTTAIQTRYEESGRMEDLEEAIIYHHEALALRPCGHPDRYTSLGNVANALRTRYDQSGRIEDLQEAITYHREALALCPPRHSDHPRFLNNLAAAVFTCYQQSGSMIGLEETITYHREALTLFPPGHPRRLRFLNNLSELLRIHYTQLGGIDNLEEAITYDREALTLLPPGHPARPSTLDSLATSICVRYGQFGRMEYLEEVIKYYHEVLTLCPLGHSDHGRFLNNLAIVICTRYRQSGRMEDLKEAITYFREALALSPPGHPGHCNSIDNLATAIRFRYEQSGRMEDLEEAIIYHREALALRPCGHPDRPTSLSNIAGALHTRYNLSGRMEDFEEMIIYHYEALALCPCGHSYRSRSLNNLAAAILARYQQSGRIEDLEETITYQREALTLFLPGHPYRPRFLNNLSKALRIHYTQLGGMDNLEEAITYSREALTLCPPGHPDRSSSLHNIANAMHARYVQSDRKEDLEEAISYHREALTLRPLGHPYRSNSLNSLASMVLTRYEKLGMVQDSEESFMLFEQGVNDLAANSMDRLVTAINWSQQARYHHHSSIMRAYSMSLHLLDRCLIFYPSVESQQKFLATAHIPRSLASDAASAAIDANELEKAVELLEQGRAILWSKMKGYRYPLDQLRHVNTQLADELEEISLQLEQLALSSESGPIDRPRLNLDVQLQKNRILSAEWEQIVRQIRKIDGFHNFLQAVPFPTLQTAAVEGPVILINISEYHSDAIIILIDRPPTLVALPNVEPAHLTRLGEQLALAQQPDTTNPSNLILPILRYLWNDIVSPVCDCLTQLAVPHNSRIWWCPTSELCTLPLHAAGPYQPKKRNLPDIYISSYIPTLSALISARSAQSTSIVPKLLVIGQPSESLKNVQDEIDDVQRQLGDFVNVILGTDANRDAVLRSLQQHSWAHFACHGHLGDNSQPFHASFELHGDSRLTLLDLIKARLPNAELAFLSACYSAAGELSTPDETIHLAAALQFCGFRSVVGTLWAMEDEDGPVISKEFYKHMFRNPENQANYRDSAKALSLAIREMRRKRVPLERWTMFVHIGA